MDALMTMGACMLIAMAGCARSAADFCNSDLVCPPEFRCADNACVPENCGDGRVGPLEVCDDGNNEDGDGCSRDCLTSDICDEPSDVLEGEACIDYGYDAGNLSCSVQSPHAFENCETWGWKRIALDTAGTVTAVGGSGPSDVYAVGDNELVVHYDGDEWRPVSLDLPSTADCELPPDAQGIDFYAVSVSSSGDGYVVGECGIIVALRGGEQTAAWQVIGVDDELRGVWAASVDDVFAVGDDGVILRYDGRTWRFMTITAPPWEMTTIDLYAVWGTGPDNVYAVGGREEDGGAAERVMARFDGAMWTPVAIEESLGCPAAVDPCASADPDDRVIRTVWGNAADDVYAAGDDGCLQHFDGASWRNVCEIAPLLSDPLSIDLAGIWGSSRDSVFVGGEDGSILFWDGVHWAQLDTSEFSYSDLRALWGSSAQDVYVAGDDGVLGRHTGMGWAVFHYRPAGGQSDKLPDATAMWGTGVTDIYAVGDRRSGQPEDGVPLLIRYDGSVWTDVPLVDGAGQAVPSCGDLNSIWGDAAGNIWAVGECDRVLHYDGSAWRSIAVNSAPSCGVDDLEAVWVADSGEVFAVGDRVEGNPGVIVRFVPGQELPTCETAREELRGVWGAGPDRVYAVGERGLVIAFDGVQWREMSSAVGFGPNEHLERVGGAGDDVYVVGTSGAMARQVALGAWEFVELPTARDLVGLWVPDASTRYAGVFATGVDGTIVRSRDGEWDPVRARTRATVNAAWGTDGITVFGRDAVSSARDPVAVLIHTAR